MDPKLLTESGLKAILSKHKVKDNGLQKALAEYNKLEDAAHDDCLETIAQIGKLAAALKKVKEVAGNRAVADYLDDLLDAADSEEKDVSKAKATAEKTEAANQKKAQKEKDEEEDEKGDEEEGDEEEEAGEYGDRLLTAFKKLKTMNGKTLKFVVCDARPFCALAIGKRIGPKQKEELTALTGGSKRFLKPALCFWDGDQYVFEPEQMVPGLAKKLVRAVKNFTGKKFRMVVGNETAGGDDEELEGGEPEGQETEDRRPDQTASPESGAGEKTPPPGVELPSDKPGEEPPLTGVNPDQPTDAEPSADPAGPFSIKGAVGRGGKNSEEDVKAVQAALNKRANAGLKVDGQCGPKTIAAIMAFQKTLGQFAADGRIDPGRGTARALAGNAKIGPAPEPPKPIAPPKLGKPDLSKAPEVWHGTRDILNTNIQELKKGIRAHYGAEHPDILKEIDSNLVKLDGPLGKLDTRLADSLKKAHAAKDDATRNAELKNSKAILTDYIKYVKLEPLIAHMDKNPFGVDTQLKKVLIDALTHMAQSIG